VGGVAILIKDQPITLYDVKQKMANDKMALNDAVEILIREKLEEVEAKKRKLNVTNQEVYNKIGEMAKQNKMTISQLYEAMQSVRGLSSKQLKERIKTNALKEKLFNAIAFTEVQPATDEEALEYYTINQDKFRHPESFSIITYQAKEKEVLVKKIQNPMFYSPDVKSENQTIVYKEVNPRLAELLNETKISHFTLIVPSPDGGHMSFFILDKVNVTVETFESARRQIDNDVMGKKRNQVLNDYFARLRLNSDIQMIRLPKN
jgi:parvulin-like peptidyl-prolyl isomerase